MGEVGVREIVEILLKKKRFIAIFTSASILVGAAASYLLIKPVYDIKTTLAVSPVEFKTGLNAEKTIVLSGELKTAEIVRYVDNKVLGSVLSDVKYPKYSVNDIVNLISAKEYIEKCLTAVNIDVNTYDYRGNIRFGYDDKKNILSVSVKHNDQQSAEKIRNAIVAGIPGYIQQKAEDQFKAISVMLDKGIERESKNLVEWKEKLDTFSRDSGGETSPMRLTAGKQAEYEKINNSYRLSQGALDAYLLVKKEMDNKYSVSIENMLNTHVIAEDKLPLKPVSPKKGLNIAAAAVLGFVASAGASLLHVLLDRGNQGRVKRQGSSIR